MLALDAEAGWLVMEMVRGESVKEVLQTRGKKGERCNEEQRGGIREETVKALMIRIGKAVGRLHEVGVVHGDLTTSNMMVRFRSPKGIVSDVEGKSVAELDTDGEIVLIDFGLAAQSLHDEDKAVDLYVLERAFGSTHPEVEEGFQEVLRAYGGSYKGAKVVLKRLEDVRMRGRKRNMVG